MDRLKRYFNQLVRKAVEGLPYAGHYPYTVVATDTVNQTVSARSLTASMPDLTSVAFASPGLTLNLPPGTQVRIAFAGMNPNAPYVASYASGGIPPIVPTSGSGVTNVLDGGFLVTGQNVSTFALLPPQFFPAGVAGQASAIAAAAVITTGGNLAYVTHLTGGRVTPDAWTIP